MKNAYSEYWVDGALLSTMRAGGRAARLYRPADADDFISAVRELGASGEKPLVLGKGSNVMISHRGFDGTVLLTEALIASGTDGDSGFWCEAGLGLSSAALIAAGRGLRGLEFAYGIPGSVGGGVYMNAGAYGGEMKDAVRAVLCADSRGELFLLEGKELEFGYRDSVFKRRGLYALKVFFALEAGEAGAIRAKMADNMARRREKQPLEYPSCGSVFKRPEGGYAGALIERCGLKGLSVGGAQVSEKHAGFIINRGGASARDVEELIETVRREVRANTGVLLETEVEIY